LVAGLVLLLVGLAAVFAAVNLLGGKDAEPASDAKKAAERARGSQKTATPEAGPEPEATSGEVTIPGLAAYLGEAEGEEATPPDPAGASGGAAAAGGDEWVDASASPAQCGDVAVKIVSAEIDRPRLVGRSSGRVARPKQACLCVRLELHNTGKTEREYVSWNTRGDGVRLVDNRDKPCLMKSFRMHGVEIDGQLEGGKGPLRPGEVTKDVLAFEAPDDRADYLRLELPASALGEKGSLKFRIPTSMVVTTAEAAVAERSEPEREDLAAPKRAPAEPEEPDERIPIPGLTGEESDDEETGDEDATSLEEDPGFRKVGEAIRNQGAKREPGEKSRPANRRRR
jgi:hypothetical protein